jgi:orotate phosphoribosyltransferase
MVRQRLFQLLKEKSFEKRKVTLSSGKESDYYLDCRQTTLSPEGAWCVGYLVYERLRTWYPAVQAIGGPTLGADPIVTAVSLRSRESGDPIPGFLVRKKAKEYGARQRIEGSKNLAPGARVCVVEDVFTTGGSCLEAIEAVEEAGLVVAGAIAIVDRGEGGMERISSKGYRVEAIFKASEFF